jgi:hypothetical protein
MNDNEKPSTTTPQKCANCGATGTVYDTDDAIFKFVCSECDHWGETEKTTDNPPPDDGWNPTGQVPRRPTE